MSVPTCCHACHIDHQIAVMTMNVSDLDITDKTFQVIIINRSNINPKTFAQYGHQITDNQCTKEELDLPGYDLVAEMQMIKKYYNKK